MLVFSQMVRMLDVLDEYCAAGRYLRERLDGRTTGKARQKAVDRFNSQPESFVFLLSRGRAVWAST